MKYKIGDKVKVRQDLKADERYDGLIIDYSKITHIEYVEKKKEMLKNLGDKKGSCVLVSCGECPLNGEDIGCGEFEREHTLEAIKIVMEYKKTILDDIEKKYLLGIIKPFKNKVKHITKFNPLGIKNVEYISICCGRDIIDLPDFKANTMYKGMVAGKNIQ